MRLVWAMRRGLGSCSARDGVERHGDGLAIDEGRAMSTTKVVTVHGPDEVAKRLGGISVPSLVALLKAGGYTYTALQPGAKPWGPGRKLWGLTDEQIAAVATGQARSFKLPEPAGDGAATPRPPATGPLPGHDGKSRLRRSRRP